VSDDHSTTLFSEIKTAQFRLRGIANTTPVMTSRAFNRLVGSNVFLKCENFQRVGAFKFRGAFNAISRLSEEEKAKGVITFSSGNHAQAVALVGNLLEVNTTVIMPADAPQIKREATEAYGARVIGYDTHSETREEIAKRIQAEQGSILIPPFDHLDVIAGQGTAVLEFMEMQSNIETLLVPCGGGGLLSGSAAAAKGLVSSCRVIGIEPELADDATRSFKTGQLHTAHNPLTIADGTRTPSLGHLTFPLIRKLVDDMQTVSETDIIEAVRYLFYRLKLVVEPSGALGLAALLSGRVTSRGNIGVILSGGNIDGPTMSRILTE
jgi:threonine dehydratase